MDALLSAEAEWTRPTFAIEELNIFLIIQTCFENFIQDTISSESLNNKTGSEDEVNTETILLSGSEMNYDNLMKMLTI
jgi:hypothetical protein